jgi:hypothetical protein
MAQLSPYHVSHPVKILARVVSFDWLRNPAESRREFSAIVTDRPDCVKISKSMRSLKARAKSGRPADWTAGSDIIWGKVIGAMPGRGDGFLNEHGTGPFLHAESWEGHQTEHHHPVDF